MRLLRRPLITPHFGRYPKDFSNDSPARTARHRLSPCSIATAVRSQSARSPRRETGAPASGRPEEYRSTFDALASLGLVRPISGRGFLSGMIRASCGARCLRVGASTGFGRMARQVPRAFGAAQASPVRRLAGRQRRVLRPGGIRGRGLVRFGFFGQHRPLKKHPEETHIS